MPKPCRNYVSLVRESDVLLRIRDPAIHRSLKDLGAKRSYFGSRRWAIDYRTEEDLARIMESLRDLQVCFSADLHGWSPSDVFVDLRNKGLIKGTASEISWTGPGQYSYQII